MPIVGEPRRRDGREIGTVEHDAAAAWPQHARDHVEQRGFAGAVGADHAADFACGYIKADIGNGLQAAKTLAEMFDAEQGGHDSHRLRRL